jgi:DNA gyrase subunit B
MDKLRYHKVIIMCDADVDGSHISTNINILFRFMKNLLKKVMFIAAPPLYLVKRKEYAWNDAQRNEINERMGGSASIQRYKGLGK